MELGGLGWEFEALAAGVVGLDSLAGDAGGEGEMSMAAVEAGLVPVGGAAGRVGAVFREVVVLAGPGVAAAGTVEGL